MRSPHGRRREAAISAFAAASGYELVAGYEDLEAPGLLLYYRPGIKAAINNIKELEEWEVLLIAEPACVSDTESALHEFVHKLSLYGNRLESPARSWEEFLAAMKSYRRAMGRTSQGRETDDGVR